MAEWEEAPIAGETPIDPTGLKIPGITTRAELNVVEAQNIRRSFVKYLSATPSRRTAPFDAPWCQKLHREMFGEVWKWAGRLRSENLNIGLPFAAIPESFAALVADLPHWTPMGMALPEQAARLHHRAVQIHPFVNGNGRWSRMLANIWLKQNGHGIIEWPEETIWVESIIRSEYIEAIKLADDGNYDPLLEIHQRYIRG